MTCVRLKACDGRKAGLLSDWDAWMQAADILYNRTLYRAGYSPFCHHEVSAMGLLAGAAAMVGFAPFLEYELEKADTEHGKWSGRADLWFSSDKRCYSFEAKRAYVAATSANLEKVLAEAKQDAQNISVDEYNYAAGLLISYVSEEKRIKTYEAFAADDTVDLAYKIGPDGLDAAFLFFTLLEA